MRLGETYPDPRVAAERTKAITGHDATMDEAMLGDAGNGADPFGADLTGGFPRDIEDEPDYGDIVPDVIERAPGAYADEDEDEYTARPREQPPLDLSELP
jgi:hypothetical protein